MNAILRNTLFASALSGFTACGGSHGTPRGVTAGTLTIATYNVNFERITAGTLEAIKGLDADIVLLQETHEQWEQALLASELPWSHVRFQRSGADGGMAILSHVPVREVAWAPSTVGPFPAWRLEVDVKPKTLSLLAVHLHPPLDDKGLFTGYFTTGGVRGAEAAEHLSAYSVPPDLVVGDFNEGSGQATAAFVAAGLTSIQSRFPPAEPTWNWETDYGTLTGQPDHIFFGPRLVATGVQVSHVGESDHWPLRAVFEFAP